MRHRDRVLVLLILLFVITYIDRVCISVAGPRMQQELGITPVGWGWVTGMFTFSYCLFEIPTGVLGDRLGARRVLTRIVLWWSTFTTLTGLVSNYYLLLAARFCFGAGEAGAFPNASIVIARWFPATRRASIAGTMLMAGQIGGAVTPLIVVPIQMRYGWRASFLAFGVLGVLWAIFWYSYFRDSPPEGNAADTAPAHGSGFPWRVAFRSGSVLSLMAVAFCYVYVYGFFQAWIHTFLVKGRGFSETGLLLSALPYAVAACTNLAGGAVSDALVLRFGLRWGRRVLGVGALGAAGGFTVAAMLAQDPVTTLILLSLVYGMITFQQSGVFGVSLDIGRKHAGAMIGLMNTCAQVGALVSSVAYGYIVERFQSYDAPFVPMAALLFLGSALWLKVDASRELEAERTVAPAAALDTV